MKTWIRKNPFIAAGPKAEACADRARLGFRFGPWLIAILLLWPAPGFAETAAPAWVQRYSNSTGGWGVRCKAVVDVDGNVIVSGWTSNDGTNLDLLTIKYSGDGVLLWTNRFDGSERDYVGAIAADGNGNVFVAGSLYSSGSLAGYATIKYSADGVPLWTNRYTGQNSVRTIAVDGDGNVFVTGTSYGSQSEGNYATLKYSGDGVSLWTNRYNWPGGASFPNAIAVDGTGNVFVTGDSARTNTGAFDYATIKYSGAGVPLWTNRFNDPFYNDSARAIAVDGSGNVFVTGVSDDLDYATIKYSGGGVPLWTNRYNSPGNGSDYPVALAADGSGNVFVTGISDGDYATIKYSGDGVPLWTNRYNSPGNGNGCFDLATAIAVDGSGNAFVTGRSCASGSSNDWATIKYSVDGLPLWTNRFIGPGNADDQAANIAIGPDGAVYVAGLSDIDFVTVKYVTLPQLVIQPLAAGSAGANLSVSGARNSTWSIERALTVTGPWTNLGQVTIPAGGSVPFQDANRPDPAALYCARLP